MGSSVDISWIDGPTGCEVAAKTTHLKGDEYLNEYINTRRITTRAVMLAAAQACARHYGTLVPEVRGGEFDPYVISLVRVGNEAICDQVHRAIWATSVYDTTLEEAFKRVFP